MFGKYFIVLLCDQSVDEFDLTTPKLAVPCFTRYNWIEFYPDVHEMKLSWLPEGYDSVVSTTGLMGANHTGCCETRRSHTVSYCSCHAR